MMNRASALRVLKFPASTASLSKAEVARAFKREILARHPDKVGNNTERTCAEAQMVIDARDYLLKHLLVAADAAPPVFMTHFGLGKMDEYIVQQQRQHVLRKQQQAEEAAARQRKKKAEAEAAAAAVAERLAKAKQKLAAARASKPAAARADTDRPAQPYAYKQACAEASESPLQRQQEDHAEWLRNKQRMQEERAAEWLKRMSAAPDAQPSPPAEAAEASAEAAEAPPSASKKPPSMAQRRADYMARKRRGL